LGAVLGDPLDAGSLGLAHAASRLKRIAHRIDIGRAS
jgi:hypothetical protein